MSDSNFEKFIKFLDPDYLKPFLISASMYIAVYEMLRETVIGKLKDFYLTGFDSGKLLYDNDKYEKDVLGRKKSVLASSLDWLKENEAITDEDEIIFKKITDYRNDLAHRMQKLVFNEHEAAFAELFVEMRKLLDKVSKWWILNVDIPTNPDYIGEDVDEQQVISGQTLFLDIMVKVALSEEEEAKCYLKWFKKTHRE